MPDLTAREAADVVDQADLGVDIDSSDALRVLVDHARATDPAAGGDLADALACADGIRSAVADNIAESSDHPGPAPFEVALFRLADEVRRLTDAPVAAPPVEYGPPPPGSNAMEWQRNRAYDEINEARGALREMGYGFGIPGQRLAGMVRTFSHEQNERFEERRHDLGLALGWDPDEESTLTWGHISQGIRDLRDLLTALSPEAGAVAADAGYDEPADLRAAVKKLIAAVVEGEGVDRWQIDQRDANDPILHLFRGRAEYKRHVANMLTRALALPDSSTPADGLNPMVENRSRCSENQDGLQQHRWGTGRAKDECDNCDAPRWVAAPSAAEIEARFPAPTQSLAATVAEETERIRARWRAGTDQHSRDVALLLDQVDLINRLTGVGHVHACCARDALRAQIANAEGRYVGGYHGDGQTAMKATASLEMAVRRHPGHELTQPDKYTGGSDGR